LKYVLAGVAHDLHTRNLNDGAYWISQNKRNIRNFNWGTEKKYKIGKKEN
jgi:hypothetical protein